MNDVTLLGLIPPAKILNFDTALHQSLFCLINLDMETPLCSKKGLWCSRKAFISTLEREKDMCNTRIDLSFCCNQTYPKKPGSSASQKRFFRLYHNGLKDARLHCAALRYLMEAWIIRLVPSIALVVHEPRLFKHQ